MYNLSLLHVTLDPLWIRYAADLVRPQTDLTSALLAEVLEPDPGENLPPDYIQKNVVVS